MSGSALPQFDTSFYTSQVFWLCSCLMILFLFIRLIFVPFMEKMLSNSIFSLEDLKNDFLLKEKEYQQLVGEFRQKELDIERDFLEESKKQKELFQLSLKEEKKKIEHYFLTGQS